MKSVGVSFCGKRYNINLEEEFAAYVESLMVQAGINFHTDNRPDVLLKAYLRLAKQLYEYDGRLDRLSDDIERTLQNK